MNLGLKELTEKFSQHSPFSYLIGFQQLFLSAEPVSQDQKTACQKGDRAGGHARVDLRNATAATMVTTAAMMTTATHCHCNISSSSKDKEGYRHNRYKFAHLAPLPL
jgi:hypothetical protein